MPCRKSVYHPVYTIFNHLLASDGTLNKEIEDDTKKIILRNGLTKLLSGPILQL